MGLIKSVCQRKVPSGGSARNLPEVCQALADPPSHGRHLVGKTVGKTGEGCWQTSGRSPSFRGLPEACLADFQKVPGRPPEGSWQTPVFHSPVVQWRFLCTPVFHSPSSTGLPKAFPGLPTARARRSGARIMVARHGKGWEGMGREGKGCRKAREGVRKG